jgi:cytochrome c biogenesis protein CcmG/thiol:disulfide interchange protein DsbE
MNRIVLFVPLAIFGALAVLFWRGLSLDPSAMPSALLDRPMPEFELPSLADPEQTISNKDLVGQPMLLNVWATWCAACRTEHPFLVQLAEQGVPIYGINYKDDTQAALQWLEDLENPYVANIVDADGRLGIDLGVFGAPETYVLDANGVIRYKHVGVLNEKVWVEQVAPILFSETPR